MRRHQIDGAECEGNCHQDVHEPLMLGEKRFELGPSEEPYEIAGRARQREKQPHAQKPPRGVRLGQHKGAQRRDAKEPSRS